MRDRGAYYRSVRRDGQPRRVYVGRGELADLIEQREQVARSIREMQRLQLACQVVEAEMEAEAPAPFVELYQQARTAAGLAMVAAGFHQHKREWRRRRMSSNQKSTANGKTSGAGIISQLQPGFLTMPPGYTFREAADLYKRAQGGDEAALPLVREMLAQPARPDGYSNITAAGGDTLRVAQYGLILGLAGKDLVRQEALKAWVVQLRGELRGDNPTAVEALLAENVISSALHHAYLEFEFAVTRKHPPVLLVWEKAIALAQRRLLSAIKALETVRGVAVPILVGAIERPRIAANAPAVLPLEQAGELVDDCDIFEIDLPSEASQS
jgi:hypothetical protein